MATKPARQQCITKVKKAARDAIPMALFPARRHGVHVPDTYDAVADWEPEDGTLDPGIAFFVRHLRAGGFDTMWSCEGGPKHDRGYPYIRFAGDAAEGLRALAWALKHNMPVEELRRVWRVIAGEPREPLWELTLLLPGQWRDEARNP